MSLMPASLPPPLAASHLSIGFRQRGRAHPLAADLTLTLHAGEMICLLGPNGAGKSTLLRTLCGMQPPLAGEVTLDGVPLGQVPPELRAQRLSIVLTDRVAPGMMTARALIALGRHPHTGWLGHLTDHDHQAVDEAIAAVGIAPLAERFVADLSDGERQKVMIARALAQQPAVILLDEPTAFLDLPRRIEIMHLLSQIARAHGTALLISTHDLDLALHLADLLWLLPGDGRLISGAPEALSHDGTLQRTFSGAGFHFEASRSAFVIDRPPASHAMQAHLTPPDHPLYEPTKRAIERLGLTLAPADAPVTIVIADTGGAAASPEWRVLVQAVLADRCTSLYDLTRALRAHF